jgi:hypothetical protein
MAMGVKPQEFTFGACSQASLVAILRTGIPSGQEYLDRCFKGRTFVLPLQIQSLPFFQNFRAAQIMRVRDMVAPHDFHLAIKLCLLTTQLGKPSRNDLWKQASRTSISFKGLEQVFLFVPHICDSHASYGNPMLHGPLAKCPGRTQSLQSFQPIGHGNPLVQP